MPSDPRHSESDAPGYDVFVGLLTRHEPAPRRFVRTLLPEWSDVDEVMQRTALAAWRKFGLFDPATDLLKWALVIARYEALAYRRAMGRDRLVFSNDFIETLAHEATDKAELTGFGKSDTRAVTAARLRVNWNQ